MSMTPPPRIRGGVYAALVTPFDETDALDLGAFRCIVEYVVGCGIHGIVVAGSTGENHALDDAEKEQLWRAAVAVARGRCPVVAGTGATTTCHALRLQRIAADCGCDAAMALTPWFGRPSTEAVHRYYAALAEQATIPILLYHIPSLTGLDWPPEAVARIAREFPGRVIGLKDATNTVERVRALRPLLPPEFLLFSGGPHQRAAFEAAGTNGHIDSLATALPAEAVDAWNGQPRNTAYFTEVGAALGKATNWIAFLKHMMSAMDLPAGRPRRPHDALTEEEKRNAPNLRTRGGTLSSRPAWGYTDADIAPLLGPGLYERCLAAKPIQGLERFMVFRAAEGDCCYNHHAQLAWFDNRFWVGWSAGWYNEDSPGQMVRVATSADGRSWSAPMTVTPPPEGRLRWAMGGFWDGGDGRLRLIAGRTTRVRYVDGTVDPCVLWENPWQELFELTGGAWRGRGRTGASFFGNEPPLQLPDGQWIMPGVDGSSQVVVAMGKGLDLGAWQLAMVAPRTDNWSAGGTKLTEPSLYRLPDGSLRLLLRDDGGSRRLFLTESPDGRAWTPPRPTDFSDAQSKFRCLNLSDGRVAVICNPAPDDLRRRLLAVAVSEDGGRTFTKLHKLLCDPAAKPRHAGMHKVGGFSYPGVIERDGFLCIVCAPNKEDIEFLRVPLRAL
jgi:4-hydroxy-tetrahydrodipicolinate synthase